MRHATEQDLPRIVQIYNSTVPTRTATADLEEVSVEARREWFLRHTPQARPILVHEVEGVVVAWLSFEPFNERAAYRYTAEISLYVASEHRGRGLGRRLTQEAIEMAPALGIRTLVARIFSHNMPSISVVKALGFDEWGKLPDVAEMDGVEYSLSIFGKRVSS